MAVICAGAAGVGVVEENGAGASHFHVKQRVVATPWPSDDGNGTWQQYVVVEEKVWRTVGGHPCAVIDVF